MLGQPGEVRHMMNRLLHENIPLSTPDVMNIVVGPDTLFPLHLINQPGEAFIACLVILIPK